MADDLSNQMTPEAYAALEAELKDKNEELERANTQLREAGELKSAFIQVASHELRTPLTILTGLSKLALRAEASCVRCHEAGIREKKLVEAMGFDAQVLNAAQQGAAKPQAATTQPAAPPVVDRRAALSASSICVRSRKLEPGRPYAKSILT